MHDILDKTGYFVKYIIALDNNFFIPGVAFRRNYFS
jgi:hypothetical protein